MHRVITVSSVSLKTSLSPLIACWVSLQICVVTETIDSAFNLTYRLGCENEQVKRQKIKDSIHNSIHNYYANILYACKHSSSHGI